MAALSGMIRIARKNVRITICSMKDFPEEKGVMRLYRKGIYSAWAHIGPKKSSQFNSNGYVVNEPGNKISHIITVTYRPDIEISNAAWIYHERQKSAPQWFRIISILQKHRTWEFSCRLYEKSDQVIHPVKEAPNALQAIPLPANVNL